MAERLQIVWTPWRDHSELLSVRKWFFPNSASSEPADPDLRRKACEQVSAWKLRGNLPHAVESTWLLTEAVLIDEKPAEQMPIFAIKASHITAISRCVSPSSRICIPDSNQLTKLKTSFVTGLLDSQQESKYKISMYTQAQKIGLPAVFVDLRHEATHGDMPNLTNLRSAAQRALEWLWDDYWKGLGGDVASVGNENQAILDGSRYVREEVDGDDEEQPGGWQRWQGRWTPKPIGTV
ncbi:MAG: rRNA-processing protein las1 [Alectoria sarmentosa]|nr:MAG: rRNA-processing protein las1 [Alectoria sarmentosa]